jgi:hypothetical protein
MDDKRVDKSPEDIDHPDDKRPSLKTIPRSAVT